MKIIENKQFNGIEIYFDSKPNAATIAKLKEHRFRWHSAKKCWYAVATAQNKALAESLTRSKTTEAKDTATPQTVRENAFGVKVGDLFVCDWGYDQTNINFFQVVALVGSQSVRVREVTPRVKNEKFQTSMSRDIVCEIPAEILPPQAYSVFIDNQTEGDLKRLTRSPYNGEVYFKVGNGHHCEVYKGETLYESWYA